nr:hypothetical protein [Bacteroidota bacterium]
MKYKLTDAPSELPPLKVGDEVDLFITHESELGYSATINGDKEGLIFRNEVFEPIGKGDYKRGYIKAIRDDGKIDLSLQKIGFKQVYDAKDVVLQEIKARKGKLPLGDKSAPADIMRVMQMSKKVFKKALGILYKERLVVVGDFETLLTNNEPE